MRRRRRNPVPKLLEYYDLREFDFDTGKPIPLEKGSGATCDRCKREHAKVYVVQTVEGTVKSVGSGCCKRAFDGWEPSKDEVKTAKKEFRARRDAARAVRVEEMAKPLVAALDRLTVPDWKRIASRFKETESAGRQEWGDPSIGYGVWLDAGDMDRPSDRRERLYSYRLGWIGAMADRLPLETPPRGFSEHEIRRAARHEAIEHRRKGFERDDWAFQTEAVR